MIVGFAYPPSAPDVNADPNDPRNQILETTPAVTVPNGASSMVHGDFHMGNLMFGSLETPQLTPPGSEHDRIPIMKALDFGFARILTMAEEPAFPPPASTGPPVDFDLVMRLAEIKKAEEDSLPPNTPDDGNFGTVDNKRKIALILTKLLRPTRRVYTTNQARTEILSLLAGIQQQQTSSSSSFTTTPSSSFPIPILPSTIPTPTTALTPEETQVDRDLIFLLARCLSTDPAYQPRLSRLLELVLGYVRTRAEQYYSTYNGGAGAARETDVDIERVVQACILDASASADDNTGGNEGVFRVLF
ncbi:hypothetical protein F5Y16DRAFT_371274 [Xylariaceae sp. FL0255]|nr:hypothetical protein F5Y16DRAFT_371274 [Xylariaceae sp. FL0255]